MHAPRTQLGDAVGHNVAAAIPDYAKELLLIDGDITGSGKAVRDYFNQTPLKKSLGAALDEIQVGGDVSGAYILIFLWTAKQLPHRAMWF